MQNVHQISWHSCVTRGNYARLLATYGFSWLTTVFVFSHCFKTRCFFFCSFGCVKGIGNAPRLTGNSSHRKHTLSSTGSPPLHLYISNCILLPLQSYDTKVDVQKQGHISSFIYYPLFRLSDRNFVSLSLSLSLTLHLLYSVWRTKNNLG